MLEAGDDGSTPARRGGRPSRDHERDRCPRRTLRLRGFRFTASRSRPATRASPRRQRRRRRRALPRRTERQRHGPHLPHRPLPPRVQRSLALRSRRRLPRARVGDGRAGAHRGRSQRPFVRPRAREAGRLPGVPVRAAALRGRGRRLGRAGVPACRRRPPDVGARARHAPGRADGSAGQGRPRRTLHGDRHQRHAGRTSYRAGGGAAAEVHGRQRRARSGRPVPAKLRAGGRSYARRCQRDARPVPRRLPHLSRAPLRGVPRAGGEPRRGVVRPPDGVARPLP